MRRTVTAIAATAILACGIAPAFAQQPPGNPQPAQTSQPPATNSNRTATAQTVPQATYQELLSALNSTRSQIAQLHAMSNLTTNNVHVVKVQTLATTDNNAALNQALSRNQGQLAVLRQTLAATRVTATTDNSQITLAQFLTDNKMALNQVVAVNVAAGNVTLFVQ